VVQAQWFELLGWKTGPAAGGGSGCGGGGAAPCVCCLPCRRLVVSNTQAGAQSRYANVSFDGSSSGQNSPAARDVVQAGHSLNSPSAGDTKRASGPPIAKALSKPPKDMDLTQSGSV
jgi:hypothetical protein